jgi:Fe2+ or Zn2+ uptake regulation protein
MQDCKIHLNESQYQLRQGKLKITKARLTVLDVFKHAKKPLNLKEIYKLTGGSADLVTLYRNIESLIKLALVKKVHLGEKEAHFELVGEHHHHIVCDNCGKIAEIKNCQVNLPMSSVKKSGFKKLNNHSLEFFGLCISCAKP